MSDVLVEVRDYLAHVDAGRRNADTWLRELVGAIAERDADAEALREEIAEMALKLRMAQHKPGTGHLTPVEFARVGGSAFVARVETTTPMETQHD